MKFFSYSYFSSLMLLVMVAGLQACGGGGAPTNEITDTTPPVITLNGANAITLVQGETYIEAGATAVDDRDGNVSVTITGTVDINSPANYTITYTAVDVANNKSATTRTIVIESQRPFVTSWQTDIAGFSPNNQIKITTTGGGYNYTVDWGDSQTNTHVTGDVTHIYATAGTYTVTISGAFPRFLSGAGTDAAYKLLSIEQWGTIKWQSMSNAFQYCANLVVNAVDVPDLSQVTDMSFMFSGASAFNQDISTWNVTSVANMRGMFSYAIAFNQDLSTWDVSSVTDMSNMFDDARSFNQDLSSWDTSSVIDMSWMFAQAYAFNGNLSTWNVSSVTDMRIMFLNAGVFNQDISSWDVSSVIDMSNMFDGARSFDQDLSAWDVSSVTDMNYMFHGAYAFNQDLSTWNVSLVTDMNDMFNGARVFNQNIGNWDVSSVTDMSSMFSLASDFNQDISSWDVSSVTDMTSMFWNANAFNQNLSTWDVSSVTNMSGMFAFANLSIANYDALLLGWSAQSLQNTVTFSVGNTQYSSTSQAARDILTAGYGWIIDDGGVAP